MFGWIWDTVEYQDVTLPENLLTKGQEYLSSVINESITIELSAVDLHHLNCDIEKFKKGDLVRVISIPHKIDRYFQVSKLSLSLDDPKSSKLTLGQTFSTLTQNQAKENKNVKDLIMVANEEGSKTQKELNTIKKDVQKLDTDVKELNSVVVEIPDEYVKTKTFETYQKETEQKIESKCTIQEVENQFVKLEDFEELKTRVETLENGGTA